MENSTTDSGLANRLIIVTGASSGVGYATVRRLIQNERATVIAIGRRRMFRLEAFAAHIGEGRLIPKTTDMAIRSQAESLIQEISDQYGEIHGFIHAVNRVLKLPALDVSDAEFDLTMQVNVKSALYGIQSVAPIMRDQKHGAVVVYNPMPITSESFVASEAVYTAASHALSALTAGWARQLYGNNIVVREISPELETGRYKDIYNPHDQLLVQALHESLAESANKSSSHNPRPVSDMSPKRIVLKERGGLALTWF
jgi:NADP-dependent 3-hydroxy acid dehydrogenase YdfG